jgi:geranylgeranyl pyrophosphate synthase
MDIEKFVNEVTRRSNYDVKRVISEKNFAYPYHELLEDSLKIFDRRWDAALEICSFKSLSLDSDENESKAYNVATAGCLLTQAIFVLDDVIDKSKEREGKSAIWAKYGINETLIAIHTLVELYMGQLVHIGLDRSSLEAALSNLDTLLRGEYRDILRNKRAVLTEAEYWKLCSEKSGAITRMYVLLAAKAAHVSPEKEKIAIRCGELMGILSQVIDDLLDLEKDISEGKTSLPMILLEKCGRRVTKDRLWEDLKECRVLESIKQEIIRLTQEGINLTFKLGKNEYVEMFRDVFTLWHKFYSTLLEREDSDLVLKAVGADGIEKSFELIFIRTKPEMGMQEINQIINESVDMDKQSERELKPYFI